MPYEDDYKMWLEKSLIEMNPDWVCDEMSNNEFTHNWCHQYCGEDNAYITPKCLHMYYHHIARADRKTESNSEKPNNSTISKMEQVDKDINVRSKDEPQIFICACETCKHRDEDWNSEACDGCCENNDHYEPKDEPKTQIKTQNSNLTFEKADDPQTERSE